MRGKQSRSRERGKKRWFRAGETAAWPEEAWYLQNETADGDFRPLSQFPISRIRFSSSFSMRETEEQLAVLRRMEGCVGKRELDSVCVYLDISTRYGSLEEQTEGIRRYLKLQMHYDASRLRRGKRDDSSCFI